MENRLWNCIPTPTRPGMGKLEPLSSDSGPALAQVYSVRVIKSTDTSRLPCTQVTSDVQAPKAPGEGSQAEKQRQVNLKEG